MGGAGRMARGLERAEELTEELTEELAEELTERRAAWRRPSRLPYSAATGILPIFACHSAGPVLWTEVPLLSTATVTGMSLTSNS